MGNRPEDLHDASVFIKTYNGSIIDAEVTKLLGAVNILHSKIQVNHFTARLDTRSDVK